MDPGGTLRTLTELIYERGVKAESTRIKQELREEFGSVAQNFAQQIAPMAINSYKQNAFSNPAHRAAMPMFEQMLAQEMQVNPGVVNNTQALDTLRTLALGRAIESGQIQMGQQSQSLPFSETAGSLGNSFGAPTPQGADPQAVRIGQLLGIDPKVVNTTHQVFLKNGVYRND